MKRREFNKSLVAASAVSLSPFSLARKARAATGASGATQVFNFTNFSASPPSIGLANYAAFNGSSIKLFAGNSHNGGAAYYTTQQAPNSFTTQFTFNFQGLGSSTADINLFFVIQKIPSWISGGSPGYVGDANMGGYGGAINQLPPVCAIGIKFDPSISAQLTNTSYSSSTGLYLNQGVSPYPDSGLDQIPYNDLTPYGINFYTGNTFQVTMVYDGSLLTMVIRDMTTSAQARYVWPLNLANATNGYQNHIGFISNGSSTGPTSYVNSWSYYTGYNTRLATPTFSVTPGNYTTSQTVTISYPTGANCYYTTNGLLPTSGSTQYTGPLTVGANTVLQAVAIQSTYTDSLVACANYVIGPTSNAINFPSGFSTGNLIAVGFAYLSGSAYRVADTALESAGAVWFPAPVPISTFSTTFQLNLQSNAQGMCFVIQNNPPASQALTGVQITGPNGQISFNTLTTPLKVGQYVTIAGTFGGTGSISGYSNPTTYIVGATNGTTTATLCGPTITATATSGSASFATAAQSLVPGAPMYLYDPGGFSANQPFYVSATGLSNMTCQLAASVGGTPITATGSGSTTLFFAAGSGGGGATLTTTTGTPTGLTFSVNNNSFSGGPTALGLSAAGLGYGGLNSNDAVGTVGQGFGILNSVAVAFSEYSSGGDPSNAVGVYTNGAAPFGSGVASGLTWNTTFNVTVSYTGGTSLAVTMQSTSGGTTFSHTYTLPATIQSIVGSSTAYIGFTGGTGGGAHSVMEIQSWTYAATGSSVAPPPALVPAAPTNLSVK